MYGLNEDPRDLYPATKGDIARVLTELALLRAKLEASTGQDTAPNDPEHLTPAEVAGRLRCTRRHVYELIRQGRIRTLRVGDAERGRLLIPTSELQRLKGEGG